MLKLLNWPLRPRSCVFGRVSDGGRRDAHTRLHAPQGTTHPLGDLSVSVRDKCQLCSEKVGGVGGGGDGLPWMPASCLPWQGRPPTLRDLPLSVAGTDRGLIGVHLGCEQNIPQRLNRGAAASPPTEWTQCGADPTWRSLACIMKRPQC